MLGVMQTAIIGNHQNLLVRVGHQPLLQEGDKVAPTFRSRPIAGQMSGFSKFKPPYTTRLAFLPGVGTSGCGAPTTHQMATR